MHLRPISAEMLCLEQHATAKELGKGCRCRAGVVACRGPSVQSMISTVDYTHQGISTSPGLYYYQVQVPLQGCLQLANYHGMMSAQLADATCMCCVQQESWGAAVTFPGAEWL